MEVSGQLHTPVALPPEKEPSVGTRRLGRPQTGVDLMVKRKILPLMGIEPRSSASYPVTIPVIS
jgi:hypothetical protein